MTCFRLFLIVVFVDLLTVSLMTLIYCVVSAIKAIFSRVGFVSKVTLTVYHGIRLEIVLNARALI